MAKKNIDPLQVEEPKDEIVVAEPIPVDLTKPYPAKDAYPTKLPKMEGE